MGTVAFSCSRAMHLPLWNATFTSEYVHPVSDGLDGFFRVLANYAPENKNRAEPNFTVDSYSQVNPYLGMRSHDGAWEASVFARNAFNMRMICDASWPTFQLSFWVRDRSRGPTLPVEHVVNKLTKMNADLYGLHDRGVIAPGRRSPAATAATLGC